jgi:hypothetical protein
MSLDAFFLYRGYQYKRWTLIKFSHLSLSRVI